jgi:hypothetical protein
MTRSLTQRGSNVPSAFPGGLCRVGADDTPSHLQGFAEALFRTRTGDPLLTMEVLYLLS